ncbi:MAG: MBL fold metallo-hydrolase [Aquificae bacterium]|nr:MBL fold metallo-hydrolase [Aquificota bacterium]
MKGKLVLLGTSSGIPTKERNTTAVYLQFLGKGFLFDCGEGTQRQIFKADLNITKIDYMLLTHLHGDHVLGAPGLIQTLDFHGKNKLKIFGTPTTSQKIDCLLKGSIYNKEIQLQIKEIPPPATVTKIYEEKDFFINSISMNHVIDCIGYSFQEKDRKVYNKDLIQRLNLKKQDFIQLETQGFVTKNSKTIKKEDVTTLKKGFKFTFITDTYETDNIIKLAKDSDILVIESTYFDEDDKAKEYKHLTLKYILKIYPELNCKKIVLTHFSRKYASLDIFKKEIQMRNLDNIYLGYDFFSIQF